jgi:hypothetical protein
MDLSPQKKMMSSKYFITFSTLLNVNLIEKSFAYNLIGVENMSILIPSFKKSALSIMNLVLMLISKMVQLNAIIATLLK